MKKILVINFRYFGDALISASLSVSFGRMHTSRILCLTALKGCSKALKQSMRF